MAGTDDGRFTIGGVTEPARSRARKAALGAREGAGAPALAPPALAARSHWGRGPRHARIPVHSPVGHPYCPRKALPGQAPRNLTAARLDRVKPARLGGGD